MCVSDGEATGKKKHNTKGNELDVGLLYWCGIAKWRNSKILPVHWIHLLQEPDPLTSLRDVFKGVFRCLWRKKCLGKCITKPQVLLWRFKFLFTHKRARRGTFSGVGRGTSVFSLSLSIPCCLRGPDKTHKYLGRGNLSMLRWDSNCLMKRLITWFCIYYLFFYFLALWCCYGTLAFEVLMVVPF